MMWVCVGKWDFIRENDDRDCTHLDGKENIPNWVTWAGGVQTPGSLVE